MLPVYITEMTVRKYCFSDDQIFRYLHMNLATQHKDERESPAFKIIDPFSASLISIH